MAQAGVNQFHGRATTDQGAGVVVPQIVRRGPARELGPAIITPTKISAAEGQRRARLLTSEPLATSNRRVPPLGAEKEGQPDGRQRRNSDNQETQRQRDARVLRSLSTVRAGFRHCNSNVATRIDERSAAP
jgi:hypothetical protein